MPDPWALQFFGGHLIAAKDRSRVLIDTGAPFSFGRGHAITIDEQTCAIPETAMGVSVMQLAELVGCEFNALLGMDVLGRLRALVDVPNKKITFGSEVQLHAPTIIPMRRLAAVPIIEVTVRGQKHEAVFDTGAPTSYVSTAMAREIAHELGPGTVTRDFYPACGRFNIETWSIPINVGSRTFWVRVGALPGEFGKLIKIFGINVILGSEILNESRAVLDFVAGEIFFDEDSQSGSARPH